MKGFLFIFEIWDSDKMIPLRFLGVLTNNSFLRFLDLIPGDSFPQRIYFGGARRAPPEKLGFKHEGTRIFRFGTIVSRFSLDLKNRSSKEFIFDIGEVDF